MHNAKLIGVYHMSEEENKKNRIMEYSFKKFTSMGISHVTMEEISRGVGIGKGTLYKFFPSKEALLFATIDFVALRIEKKIQEIIADKQLNPAEKLSLVIKTVGDRLSKINPAVLSYIERSVPEAYDKIIEVRQRIIMSNILKLFEEGKNSGHFEPDMDAYLTAHIVIGAANHVIGAQVLPTLNYNLDSLMNNVTATILKGCLTEEGRKSVFNK